MAPDAPQTVFVRSTNEQYMYPNIPPRTGPPRSRVDRRANTIAATMDGTVRCVGAAALLTLVMVACGGGATGTGAMVATSSEGSAAEASSASTSPQATTVTSSTPTSILSEEEQRCVDTS